MKFNNPLFSILIPTYNSAETIHKCLDSIICQGFRDFEILVIDGASKDKTIEIVSGYDDERIKYSSQKDNGIYDAMNKGIKWAKGEWIYFLGSDDELYNPEVLQQVATFISGTKADVVYGNVLVDGNAGWAADGDIYDGSFDIKKLLLKNICHQSIFYRKQFVEEHNISFDQNYRVCADWDFNVKCWAQGRFEFIPQVIARFNAGGASTKEVIDDEFGNEIVEKFIAYSNIRSYKKLKQVIPSERMYQLRKFKKYSWRMRIDSLAKRFLS